MRIRVAVAVTGIALAAPGTAAAHLRSSRVAVDYRATVSPLPRSLAGALSVRLYRADLAVRLTALDGHRVLVLGYLGEPFLRLDADGLFVNATSATAAGTRLTEPERGPGPRWRLRSDRPSAVWHDARVRGLPHGQKRGAWSIPLVVDGRRVRLAGTIERAARPVDAVWLALGAVFAAAMALLLAPRSRGRLRPACAWLGGIAAIATLVTIAGFAAAPSAPADRWIEGANEAALILVGGVFLVRGSPDTRALAGGFLGLVGLAAGLTNLPVFLHGIVLSALPATLMRLTVTVAIGAGAAAAVLALVVFFDILEHYEEPELQRYL